MKVALCYHGIAKGKNYKSGGLTVGFKEEFEVLKKNLIEQNPNVQFDVYLHTWSIEHKVEIEKIMKPVSSLYEESRIFRKSSWYDLVKQRVKKIFGKVYEYQRVNNIYSRWYSFHKVCSLVQDSDTEYDFIFVLRFDMVFLTPFKLDQLDTDCFYSGEWIGLQDESGRLLEGFEYKEMMNNSSISKLKIGYPYDSKGLQDFFFIASPKNMIKKFAIIFEDLPKMIRKIWRKQPLSSVWPAQGSEAIGTTLPDS